MRTIKIRAWDNSNKRMVYNGFYMAPDGDIWQDNDVHGVDMSGKRKIFPTDRFIIMQYTGCIDAKVTDIYEDDILEANWGQMFRVYWSVFHCGWVLVSTDGEATPIGKVQISLFKIIDNIHSAGFYTLDYFQIK